MNVLFVVLASAFLFLIAYKTYGNFLVKKVFQLDNKRKTPSVEMEDGVDYVPADAKFLLGQHFSAIAAAGPVSGPILAGVMFGWGPTLLWIILGSIFIGGVHDLGSLIASVRHKARSITEIIRENVSKRAYILFMLFVWITLVYIIVVFTNITTSSFVNTVTLENGEKAGGGAIATSSLLYLVLPIIMGLLLKYTKLTLTMATVIFLPLVGLSIWVGKYIPLDLSVLLGVETMTAQKFWDIFILLYCFIASIIPVWLLLQPRGHLGGYFLYAALIFSGIGILFGGFNIQYPAFTKIDGNMGQFFSRCSLLFSSL